MATKDRSELKGYFETGKRPSEQDFADLIESGLNIVDDKADETEAIDDTIDDKYLTPKTAKTAIEAFAPVTSVNGANGEVTVTDIAGNAATATALETPRTINGVTFDGTANINLPSQNFYWTDFLNAGFTQGLISGAAILASGNILSVMNPEPNHPGQVTIKKTTNTVGGGFYFTSYGLGIRLLAGMKCDFVLKTPAVFTNKTVRFGFLDSGYPTQPTNGMYFELIENVLVGKTANNSTRTSGSLFNLSASTWYHCRVTVVSTSLVRFDVYEEDGDLIDTVDITSNLPATTSFAFAIFATSASNTIEDIITLDYMSVDFGNPQRGNFL